MNENGSVGSESLIEWKRQANEQLMTIVNARCPGDAEIKRLAEKVCELDPGNERTAAHQLLLNIITIRLNNKSQESK